MAKILVTGADGFIGSHLDGSARARRTRGARVRVLQLLQLLGMARSLRAGREREVRSLCRRRARCALRARGNDGLRLGAAPRGAHRDSVLLSRAGQLRGHERHRHAEHRAGGAGSGRAASGPHVDERGVRHGPLRSHHRGTSAAGPVTVFGNEDRRGPDCAVVSTSRSVRR